MYCTYVSSWARLPKGFKLFFFLNLVLICFIYNNLSIFVFRNSVLRLQFNEFVTECGWDHLYVYDGDSVFSPLIGAFNGIIQTKSICYFQFVS